MENKLRLQEIMERKNITNVSLAEKLEVSANLISYYKTGKRTPPLNSMEKLANALGINFIELFVAPEGFFHYYDPDTGQWGGIWRKNGA